MKLGGRFCSLDKGAGERGDNVETRMEEGWMMDARTIEKVETVPRSFDGKG